MANRGIRPVDAIQIACLPEGERAEAIARRLAKYNQATTNSKELRREIQKAIRETYGQGKRMAAYREVKSHLQRLIYETALVRIMNKLDSSDLYF